MAAGILAISGIMPSRDRNGRAVVAQISVFVDGTTNFQPVFTTAAMDVPLSQPITSDDAGRFPLIYIDSAIPVTMSWVTMDGQSRLLETLYSSTSASSALTDDANAALESIQEIVANAGDLQSYIDQALAAATASSASAGASSASASAASTSASAAGASASAAASSASDAATAKTASEAARDAARASAAGAVAFTWSTSTVDADTGPGILHANNASLASVTKLWFDNLEQGGSSVTAWLDSFDDSTSTNKGVIVLRQAGTTSFTTFSVNGLVVDKTGYREVAVAYVSGATSFTNASTVGASFARTGDMGASGFGTGDMLASNNLSETTNKATARTNLGLAIGSNVQAYDAKLAAFSGVTGAADKFFVFSGASAGAVYDFTSAARTLVAQTSQATMLTAGLGLSANGQSLVTAADYAAMRTLLSLANVENKSSATIRGELTSGNVTTALSFTPVTNARTITAGAGLSGGGDLTANRTLAVDINGLTADPTPDLANDYIMSYDASAGGLKKVLLNKLGGSLMGGASSGSPGTAGACAAPSAGDQNKFWRGDGTWQEAPVAVPTSWATDQTYNSSTTYNVPAGIYYVRVSVWGGGGQGSSSSAHNERGGGGGGFTRKTIRVNPGDAITVTVGAGGNGSGSARNGQTSSFGAFCTANGGSAGGGLSGGVGGGGSGGDINYSGGSSGNDGGGSAAGGPLGNGAGGTITGGDGSTSGGGSGGDPGVPGSAPGGGGGKSNSVGASGRIIVEVGA